MVGGGVYRTLTLKRLHHLGWPFWANLLVIGLALGAVYALIALGYTLVYGILRMINFAHGEVFMVGAFASFFFARAYAASGFLNTTRTRRSPSCSSWPSLVSVGVAVLLETGGYRPLRNAPRLVPLITAIGASLFLQNTSRASSGADARLPAPGAARGHASPGARSASTRSIPSCS